MPSFASTSGPTRKVDIPIKNKRYQIPRYPFTEPMAEGTAPEPGSGMLVPWTRVSTLLDTHKDKEGIFKWVKRLVIKGIGARPDLYALAAATRLDDRATLDRIGDQAFDVAGGQASANIGSALHSFLERWLEGDKTLAIPEQWRPDVAAVTAAFQDAGITPVPELQEIVVVRPDLADGDSAGLAGRLDLVVWYEGQLTIADYKTGSDPLLYGSWEIQQQGGIYGSAWAMWDGEFWRPMPPIRRDKMLMIHVLPGAATVTISEIDLDPAELEADIESAYRTRRRRKEAKKAHRLVLKVEDGAVDAPLEGGVVQAFGKATEDDQHRSEVHPSADTFRARPSSPTPDAALQAQKAAERLAKVDQMAKAAGRNDDPDDEGPGTIEHGDTVNGFKVDLSGVPPIMNGEGKALMPLAGPGERGCGVCGRKGHRKGGKACLGDADPGTGRAARQAMTDEAKTGEQVRTEDAARTHTNHSWTRDPIAGTWSCAVGGEPAAPEVGAVLTAKQEIPDVAAGDFTEAELESLHHQPTLDELAEALISDARDRDDDKSLTTGDVAILSGDEAEIRKWWSPNSDPDDTTTEADLAAALRAGEMIRAELVNDSTVLPGTDGPEEPDPFDEDGSTALDPKEADRNLLLDRVNKAKDKADLRQIRADAIEMSLWEGAVQEAGLAKVKTF